MRKLVITDVHGCYDQMMKLLEKVNYQPESDELINLGDMIDKGTQSKMVIQEMMNLKKKYNDKVKIIMGNHEEMFLGWLDDNSIEYEEWYLSQGGFQTIYNYVDDYSLVTRGEKAKKVFYDYYFDHICFLKESIPWHEDENYIFVHAGINQSLINWNLSSDQHFRWERKMFLNEKNETKKTILFGHTPTSHLNKDESYGVWFSNDNKIGLDGGCVFGGKLHCFEINDFGYKVHSI